MASPAFREPKRITDLAEYAADYIEFMRAVPENAACETLIDYAAGFFTDVPVTEYQLQSLAVMFVDRIYLYGAELTVKDFIVTTYFAKVTRYVLDIVATRNVRVFYILDNELRQDRFEIILDLMFRSGVFVVTPYAVDGAFMQFPDVRRALNIELLAGRHIAYIEKDASVNYLGLVADLAKSTDRFVFLRNEGPASAHVQLIPSKRLIHPPS